MTTTSATRIAIVLGSNRRPRLGDRVARFVLAASERVPSAEFSLLDLADFPLPFFDEQLPPLSNPARQPAPGTARWLAAMAAADGYLFVVPEYNFAVPAVLKNALDHLATEAEGKPASVLSYSDTAHGGIIAGHELRLTLGKLGMLALPKSLPLAHADQLLAPDGTMVATTDFARKVEQFVPWCLSELARYATALRPLRTAA
jgi:NAD(P)H-dependent FMN reductase